MEDATLIKLLIAGIIISKVIVGILFYLFYKSNRLLKNERTQLLSATERIKIQVSQIENQNDALLKAEDFKSKVFSAVSHDLRVPLSSFHSLLAFSKVVEIPEGELRIALARIGAELEESGKMLNDMLVWTAGQLAKDEIKKSTFLLHNVIEETLRLFQAQVDKKDLTVHNTLPKDLEITANREFCSFIVRNLLSNAVKFSYRGGHITIGSRIPTTDQYILYVKDEGIGMNGETLTFLQQRIPSTSQLGTFQEKGAGIGLALCQDFAMRMSWSMHVESQPEQGSTFLISIPMSASGVSRPDIAVA